MGSSLSDALLYGLAFGVLFWLWGRYNDKQQQAIFELRMSLESTQKQLDDLKAYLRGKGI